MTKEEFNTLGTLLGHPEASSFIIIPVWAGLDPEEIFKAEITTTRDSYVVTTKPPRVAPARPDYYVRPIAYQGVIL